MLTFRRLTKTCKQAFQQNFSTASHAQYFFTICFASMIVGCTAGTDTVPSTPTNKTLGLGILDSNRDSFIDPYEALDVLLMVKNEIGRTPSIDELYRFSAQKREEEKQEIEELLSEFDNNNDGIVTTQEADGDFSDFLLAMDADEDGIVTTTEAINFDFADVALSSKEEIQERIDEIFSETDTNKDNLLDLQIEVDENSLGRYSGWDYDQDTKVSKDEAYNYLIADNSPVTFNVDGNTAYMTGVITSELPSRVLELLFEHREVDTIEMLIVPGSIDDEANLRASLYVHSHGLTTKLNANSSIASGGTDFFMAGTTRVVEKGASLGVHSWGGGAVAAVDVPRSDPVHQKYLDFYKTVGIPAEFYWYTLEAAPASDIHIMTESELDTYQVRTER